MAELWRYRSRRWCDLVVEQVGRNAVLSKLLSLLGSNGERGGMASFGDVELQGGAAVARDGVGGATLLRLCLLPGNANVDEERKKERRKGGEEMAVTVCWWCRR
ncbi:hypothetical protein JCGZ_23866 [Jatropha curcas]|uniref:Uncharacterized protein n=1 Tax=Jatropha curcas TaxID=180498 RepID=A0A067LFN9_JATCU|nr:hypothetical protein JCGZ_23866 [Jatropha curcas]